VNDDSPLLRPIADDIAVTIGPDGKPYMAVADTVALLRAIAGACRSTADYPGCDLRTAAHGIHCQADDLERRGSGHVTEAP
jgi:predicted transcriptional regulator